ncbi:MAG: hypothetical protein DMG04_10440 [Acidobacteria bacterium]|nr:MAG: hypothetical protein DMG04_10440 [Acidobacteriota bacterium]
MMTNALFLAGLTVFLTVGWLATDLSFLAPYKVGLFRLHGTLIVGGVLLLFFNLCAAYYSLLRWLSLGDAGRKLRHLDHQLTTRDAVLDDLGDDLTS